MFYALNGFVHSYSHAIPRSWSSVVLGTGWFDTLSKAREPACQRILLTDSWRATALSL
jgi:hypothetical protein